MATYRISTPGQFSIDHEHLAISGETAGMWIHHKPRSLTRVSTGDEEKYVGEGYTLTFKFDEGEDTGTGTVTYTEDFTASRDGDRYFVRTLDPFKIRGGTIEVNETAATLEIGGTTHPRKLTLDYEITPYPGTKKYSKDDYTLFIGSFANTSRLIGPLPGLPDNEEDTEMFTATPDTEPGPEDSDP